MKEPFEYGVNHMLTSAAAAFPQHGAEGENRPHLQTGANMETVWINEVRNTAEAYTAEDMLVAECLAAAAQGDASAYFDLGVAYSTGSHGAACDLVEAHKWFNLAAVGGNEEAATCRAEVAEEMTAREIAEAQRRAREWLAASTRRAA